MTNNIFRALAGKYECMDGAVWNYLENWFRQHNSNEGFLIYDVCKDIQGNYPLVGGVIVAINCMDFEENLLKRFWTGSDADGKMLPGEYDEMEDIPDDPNIKDIHAVFYKLGDW